MCYGIENIQKSTQWKEDAITINHHVNIGCSSCRRRISCSCIKIQMSLSQIGGSVRDLAGRAKAKKTIT
jgi:pyruvate dehydrogenase E2 component (dihydrolipoamide acetyltransferase)